MIAMAMMMAAMPEKIAGALPGLSRAEVEPLDLNDSHPEACARFRRTTFDGVIFFTNEVRDAKPEQIERPDC